MKSNGPQTLGAIILAGLIAPNVASAQVVFIVPNWQPIPAPIWIQAPAPEPVTTTIERYYVLPTTTNVDAPPLNSTEPNDAPRTTPPLPTTPRATVVIREYYMPGPIASPKLAARRSPDRLIAPPWSPEYEEPASGAQAAP